MSLMLDEIRQQPEVLAVLLEQPLPALARLRKRFSKSKPALVILVARGTSDNAAIFGQYLFQIALGIPTYLAAPSVATLYQSLALSADCVAVGISQSGESTDINSYMESAKKCGAFTIGITNGTNSGLARLADEVLPLEAGTESSVAATKTYTAEVFTLYRLAQAFGAAIRTDDLKQIPDLTAAQLEAESSAQQLAERLHEISHAVVIGRGLNYGTGLELALKLMETSYVVAAGFSGADFAHGPIAMVEKGFPVFVFTSPGPTLEQTRGLVARLRAGAAETVCIGPEPIVRDLPCSYRIEVRGKLPISTGLPDDTFTPIPSIIPGQLFAAHLAAAKGLDPDHPRMLSKVTKTL